MNSFDAFRDGAALGADPSSASAERAPTASAGFGSPGIDATVRRIDLNDALIRHPQSTFAMRASGNQMAGAGIDDGDVLLVDRVLSPCPGNIVVAVVEGELVCRRLCRQGSGRSAVLALQAADPCVTDIVAAEGDPLEIWGVVTTAIRSMLD